MKRSLVSAVLLLTLVRASAALADDAGLAFVTIDGIQGESTRTGHEGQIEGSNFSQTFRLALATGGAGGGAGKPTLGAGRTRSSSAALSSAPEQRSP